MNNNELRIKQYYPSEPPQTAESSSTLTSAGSPQEDEKPKAPRGTFKNKPSKRVKLLSVYKDIYPPRTPHKEKSAAWHKIIDAVNRAFPDDVPVHIDSCKMQVEKTVASYASTFSEHAINLNSGSSRRTTELEQLAFDIWIMKQEDNKAGNRKPRSQEKLGRCITENGERYSKKQKGACTSRPKVKQVVIDAEAEEPFGESSQFKFAVLAGPSNQQTSYEIDSNNYYSGDFNDGGILKSNSSLDRGKTVEPAPPLKQKIMDRQNKFQDDTTKLLKRSVELQEKILVALEKLININSK
ncbi:hypothetical protein HMPREF1544_01413 [Mucor circinelloides 1006PhL]|uniref:Uncharacterized protein n=1 Tax=Mucor circinelloides f. circinelloides (strain 1006PhL) TaxID=1220926 RepID=S2JT86_MUCC1|nr:hypothetical protein HMPREF1544_01413 [Mucor circinelloides 1006PhL]